MFFDGSKEWSWLFKYGIDWDKILPLYYKSYPTEDGLASKEEAISFYSEIGATVSRWARTSIRTLARELDEYGAGKVENGSTIPGRALQQIYDEAKELQFFGLSTDKRYGGMGMPYVVSLVSFETINTGSVAIGTQIAFFNSIIDMIERFAPNEYRERLISKIVAGELSGAMCLTEADAGSDLTRIKTIATREADGTYRITGTKIFISNGGGGLNFVLAKVKGAESNLNNLALFLVEEVLDTKDGKIKNYKITKNEEKMGLHGSFTCEIVYQNSVGILIGEENGGLKLMLHLMNEARNAVALQALGGLEDTLDYIHQYATNRIQFGKPLIELPLYRKNYEEWKTEVDALRAMLVDTISHFDIYQRIDLKIRHGEDVSKVEMALFKKASSWMRRRTPLAKMYATELFTEISKKGMQALGGYGYMKEYDIERLHRDSFATLIYEGTTQIQSLMALKDLIKFIMRAPFRYFCYIAIPTIVAFVFIRKRHRYHFFKISKCFKIKMLKLLIKSLYPGISRLFSKKAWLSESNVDKIIMHAESLAMLLSYLETLRVLSLHASKDSSRLKLFNDYRKLAVPKMAQLYLSIEMT